MEKIGICQLCDNERELQLSHYIPNFVSRKIKKTSATGYMRDLSGFRKPDLRKNYLLCKDCEQILSVHETYFAKQFFHPLNDGLIANKVIDYDESLLQFIISISWRLYQWDKIQMIKEMKQIPQNILELTDNWKKFLLTGSDVDIGNHYLLYWDDNLINEMVYNYGDKAFYYLLKGSDGTIVTDDKSLFYVFCQIPRISIIAAINPKIINGFSQIKIEQKGSLPLKFELTDEIHLISFIKNRINLVKAVKLSEKEIKKIEMILKKKPFK